MQVVRSVLWPNERCPVYFTGGEDARICTWSGVSGDDAVGVPKRAAAQEAAGAPAGRKLKRRRKHDSAS